MKSNFDFSIPQRQSLIGVVVLFANTLQKSVRALWPFILIVFFKKDSYSAIQVYLGIAGIIIFIAYHFSKMENPTYLIYIGMFGLLIATIVNYYQNKFHGNCKTCTT